MIADVLQPSWWADHECAEEGRPVRPLAEGERWTCPACGMTWVATFGRHLDDPPIWVGPDDLGWVGRR